MAGTEDRSASNKKAPALAGAWLLLTARDGYRIIPVTSVLTTA